MKESSIAGRSWTSGSPRLHSREWYHRHDLGGAGASSYRSSSMGKELVQMGSLDGQRLSPPACILQVGNRILLGLSGTPQLVVRIHHRVLDGRSEG
jgi:hypothetical protein